jgi:hypothetical protein
MNRGDIRTAVKRRLAIPASGDGMLTDAVINDLINNALSVISAAREWPWLLDTKTLNFDPSSDYLPNDFIRARQLVYNELPVAWVQLEDYLNPDRLSNTFAWTIIGNQAYLTPAPTTNATGTLYYYKAEPALLSDYAEPLMPALHHGIIVAYTSYLAALVRQDEGRAGVYMAEYNTLMRDTNDDLKQNTSRRIRYNSGWRFSSWT